MAYCTAAELAAALRLSPAQAAAADATLQACVDAGAAEIDHFVDAAAETPLDPADPLANRVNILRGVEWWKSNDAAFGVIGTEATGPLTAPRDSFARHGRELIPLKQGFGIA